jgi:hypothetical protein
LLFFAGQPFEAWSAQKKGLRKPYLTLEAAVVFTAAASATSAVAALTTYLYALRCVPAAAQEQ